MTKCPTVPAIEIRTCNAHFYGEENSMKQSKGAARRVVVGVVAVVDAGDIM